MVQLNACTMCNKNLSIEYMQNELDKFLVYRSRSCKVVSTNKVYNWDKGCIDIYKNKSKDAKNKFRIIAYDFGIKLNILRILRDLDCEIMVVPQTIQQKMYLRIIQTVFFCQMDLVILKHVIML